MNGLPPPPRRSGGGRPAGAAEKDRTARTEPEQAKIEIERLKHKLHADKPDEKYAADYREAGRAKRLKAAHPGD